MDKKTMAVAKKSAKAPTTKTGEIYDLIKSRENTFKSLLPQGNSSSRFVSSCLIAVKMNNKLQQCDAGSLIKAMMESARFGLEPNSPLSEAALVPYGKRVEFLIQYRGLLKLAWNSGMIRSMDFDKICANDKLVYKKGFDQDFQHEPNLLRDRGEPYAYYAYAEMKKGGKALTVMTKDEIIKHMKHYSKAYKSKDSPWVTDFDAMAIKTVIRQLVDKKLPKATTSEALLMQQAAHIDDIPPAEREEYTEVIVKEAEAEAEANTIQPEAGYTVDDNFDYSMVEGFDDNL